MHKRSITLDWMKCFLMALVVLGHAIQWQRCDFQAHWLWSRIYAFHMPAFFFLSGYFSWKEKRRLSSDIVRVIGLLVPCYVWFLLSAATIRSGALWFLFNLAIFILLAMIQKFVSLLLGVKEWIVCLIVLSGLYVVFLIDCSFIAWLRINCIPFFFMGYFVKCYHLETCVFTDKGKIFVGVCLASAILLMFCFGCLSGMARGVIRGLIAFSMTFGCFGFFIRMSECFDKAPCHQHSGIGVNCSKVGQMTLGIYASHYFFLALLSKLKTEFHYLMDFIIAFLLSVAFCLIIKRLPVFDFLLLGNTRKLKEYINNFRYM